MKRKIIKLTEQEFKNILEQKLLNEYYDDPDIKKQHRESLNKDLDNAFDQIEQAANLILNTSVELEPEISDELNLINENLGDILDKLMFIQTKISS